MPHHFIMMQLSSISAFEPINFVANVISIAGIALVAYLIYKVFGLTRRMEQVLAPKSGIEGYLAMCGHVVEADPDGLCVVDDDGEIELVNSQLENTTGYHRSELVGQSVEILVPHKLRDGHRQFREHFVSSPSARGMRGLVLQHKRGREVPVAIRLNRYVDSAGGHTIAKVRVTETA